MQSKKKAQKIELWRRPKDMKLLIEILSKHAYVIPKTDDPEMWVEIDSKIIGKNMPVIPILKWRNDGWED